MGAPYMGCVRREEKSCPLLGNNLLNAGRKLLLY